MKLVKVVLDGSPVNYLTEIEKGENLESGVYIIVETSRGLELAKTICNSFEDESHDVSFKEEAIKEEEKENFKFVKLATKKEIETNNENKDFAEKVKQETKKLIKKYDLEMKISDIKVTLDKSKVSIFFTSENRVDFRDLVKDLAGIFKTRIELRQIGSRDETRAMGGFGPCGKECCCKQFLNDFEHVSIKMAKNQNLSLNPQKISGLCGRLLCCLGYENEHYAETNKLMPKINSIVQTPNGLGKVVYNDLLKRVVQVKLGDETSYEIKNFDLSEIKQTKENNEPKGK
ncbi:MAG: stage 0 sporulation family protein [Christensenellales bacterium]